MLHCILSSEEFKGHQVVIEAHKEYKSEATDISQSQEQLTSISNKATDQ